MSLPPAIEKFRDNLQTEICNNLLEVEQLKSDLNLKGKGRRALDKNEISDIRRATLEHFNRGLVQRTDDFFREIELSRLFNELSILKKNAPPKQKNPLTREPSNTKDPKSFTLSARLPATLEYKATLEKARNAYRAELEEALVKYKKLAPAVDEA